MINCLSYIDLNVVRAGIVKWPEDYRWCSIRHQVQTRNKDDFLSLDFGLVAFGVENAQRLKKYRDFLYHAGAIKNAGNPISRRRSLIKRDLKIFSWIESGGSDTERGILPTQESLAPRPLSWRPTKYLRIGFTEAGRESLSG